MNYLSIFGQGVEDLLQATPLTPEFLQDPSAWIDDIEMEKFLYLAEAEFKRQGLSGSVVELSGVKSKDLMSWGVLDGVLKMMEKPQDILLQPERFLSYFINPPALIQKIETPDGIMQFEVALSSRDFPSVTQYLSAVFESLPTYAGNSPAQVKWEGTCIRISWSQNQVALLPASEDGRTMSPDVLNHLVRALEESEVELQQKRKENATQETRIEMLEGELRRILGERFLLESHDKVGEMAESIRVDLQKPLSSVQNGLIRMADYFNRAHQLIVLLVGQDRQTPQVREAMRRVDWDYVQREFPEVFRQISSDVIDAKEHVSRSTTVLTTTSKTVKLRKTLKNLEVQQLSLRESSDSVSFERNLESEKESPHVQQ